MKGHAVLLGHVIFFPWKTFILEYWIFPYAIMQMYIHRHFFHDKQDYVHFLHKSKLFTSHVIPDNTKGELSLSLSHTKREKQPWKEQLSSLGYWWNEEFGRISAWCWQEPCGWSGPESGCWIKADRESAGNLRPVEDLTFNKQCDKWQQDRSHL